VADLKVEDVDLDGPLRVRLHGKGDKWRSCPLWPETAELLKRLTADVRGNQSVPLFMSRQREPLTRFGIYKIVKRHTSNLSPTTPDKRRRSVSPHVFRHSTAVGLLEKGVDVKCHPSLAGTCQLGNHQPLCRDYVKDEAGCCGGLPPSNRNFGITSPNESMA
jgi:site-specific recombinase XerD